MNPSLEGYTAAVLDGPDASGPDARAALAEDVAAVERLVRRDAELHAAMTDVAIGPRARRAVLADLLSGKVSAPAARLCAYAAGAVRAQDVPSALGWLATRLRQVAEGEDRPEEPLGHRAARERVGGYAQAVLQELAVAELETVEDELFRFARVVDATPELRGALTDRDLPAAARRAVVEDLLGTKAHPATVRLATYAVTGGRPRDLVGTLDWLVEQVAGARGWRVARVRSGQEVDDQARRDLSERLSRLAGSPVELQVTVDPALLAGVDVEIGDLRLDATARGRLDRLREHVVAGGWTDLGFGRAERAAHGAPGGPGGARQDDGRHDGDVGGNEGTRGS